MREKAYISFKTTQEAGELLLSFDTVLGFLGSLKLLEAVA
jgi:hypothetical protein